MTESTVMGPLTENDYWMIDGEPFCYDWSRSWADQEELEWPISTDPPSDKNEDIETTESIELISDDDDVIVVSEEDAVLNEIVDDNPHRGMGNVNYNRKRHPPSYNYHGYGSPNHNYQKTRRGDRSRSDRKQF